ncbi:MAG: Ig-like domain-containing protein [Firmicutes bacterium]|nr:Ig-like domain-containing protein [Bacillota bacterium]
MRKIRGIVLSFITLLAFAAFIPLLAACDDEPKNIASLSLNYTSYEMAVGVSFTLTPQIFPSDASNKNVTFASSNPAVATVNGSGQVLAVSAGNVLITVTTQQGNFTQTCHVKVNPELIQLDAPSQPAYNGNKLIWGEVITEDRDYTPSYKLEINGIERTSNTMLTEFADFTPGIKYSVRVRAIGLDIKYASSAWSSPAVFTKLPTPNVNNTSRQNSKLVFDVVKDNEGNAATDYVISVTRNGAALDAGLALVFNNPANLDIGAAVVTYTIPQNIPDGEYSFAVTAIGLGAGNIWDSALSSTVSITKLNRPAEQQLVAGVVTWRNVVGAAGYRIELNNNNDAPVTRDVGAGVLLLDLLADPALAQFVSLNAQFEVRVQALGDGSTTLDSVAEGPCAVERLNSPTGLSVSNMQLTWQAVTNADHYVVMVGQGSSGAIVDGTSFDLSAHIAVGVTNVSVIAVGLAESHYSPSNPSAALPVRKLNKPASFRVQNGQIMWELDLFATGGYVIFINDMPFMLSPSPNPLYLNTKTFALDYWMDDDDKIIFAAGSYNVKIQSLGNGTTVFDSDVFELGFGAVKLGEPQNLKVENGILKWDAMPNANEFLIEIDSSGVITEHRVQNNENAVNQLLANFGAGAYGFKIKALGTVSPYLDGNYTAIAMFASKFPAPYNLRAEDGVLYWDADGIGGILPNRFSVNIGNSNYTVSTNSLPINTISQVMTPLSIRVYSFYEDSSGAVVYLNSNYSEPFNAIKLARPTGLRIVDGEFRWEPVVTPAGVVINRYIVYINYGSGVYAGQEIFGTSYLVRSDLPAGSYNIRVMACGDMINLLNSNISESFFFSVLSPAIGYVSAGVFVWSPVSFENDGIIREANAYMVFGRQNLAHTPVQVFHAVNTLSYNLSGLAAGTWYLTVVALGNNTNTFSSELDLEDLENLKNNEIEVVKLGVPGTGFGALGSSVVWNVVDEVTTYDVRVSKREDGVGLVNYGITRVGTTVFNFPGNYLGGVYQISIRAVGTEANQITGEFSNVFLVRRLQSVHGLNIADEVVGWAENTLAASYTPIINGETGYWIETNYFNYSAQVDFDNRTLNLGHAMFAAINERMNIQLVANYAGGTVMEEGQTVYVVSSAPSAVLNVERYIAPVLYVSNGLITWIRALSNAPDRGYELMLKDTMDVMRTLVFNAGEFSYALSAKTDKDGIMFNPVVGEEYEISIRARGNGREYISSNWSVVYSHKVSKLPAPIAAGFGNFTVKNGLIEWDKVEDASGYMVNWSEPGGITGSDFVLNDGRNTFNYLPNRNEAGVYTISIWAAGDNLKYINSAATAERKIYKLPTPQGLQVRNGEIDWYTWNASGNARLISVEPNIQLDDRLINFRLLVGSEFSYTVGLHELFIMRQHQELAGGPQSIRVSATGNTEVLGMLDSALALSSGRTPEMFVQLLATINDLRLKDGEVVWDSQYDNLVYDMRIDHYLENNVALHPSPQTQEFMVVHGKTTLASLAPAFENGQAIEYQISVRHRGSNGFAGSGLLYVNSDWCPWLENIKKLPVIQPDILNGAIAWDFDVAYSNYDSSYLPDIGVYVNYTKRASVAEGKGQFVLEGPDFPVFSEHSDGVVVYKSLVYYSYYIQAMGTQGDDNTSGFVNSNISDERGAYKMPQLQSITIGAEELFLTWQGPDDIELPEDILADMFVVSYRISNKFRLEDGDGDDVGEKTIIGTNKMPFWTLGTYDLSISAAMSNDSVFRSDALPAGNSFVFNKFQSGNGSKDKPFIINDKTPVNETAAGSEVAKLDYIRHIPMCWFELGQDIELPALGNQGTNFISIGTAAEPFTGGLNGKKFSISNYRTNNQKTAALFNYIDGGTVKNLNLKDVDIYGGPNAPEVEAAAIARYNNGTIYNCHVLATVAGSRIYNNATNNNNSRAGGLVVFNEPMGVISNSSSNMTITLECNVPVTYAGGIAAENKGKIEKSANKGIITANYAGGIVASNIFGGNVVVCKNEGAVNGEGKNTGGYASNGQAGGIAGLNNGDILLCYNTADITSENFSGETWIVYAGGIVGENQSSGKINNCYSSGWIKLLERPNTNFKGGIVGYNWAPHSELLNNVFYQGEGPVFDGFTGAGTQALAGYSRGVLIPSSYTDAGAYKTMSELKTDSAVVVRLNNGYEAFNGGLGAFNGGSGALPTLWWE